MREQWRKKARHSGTSTSPSGVRNPNTSPSAPASSASAASFSITVIFGYMVAATGNYDLPVQLVALMVLIAAGLFWAIDCTKGFDSKADPAAAPAAV